MHEASSNVPSSCAKRRLNRARTKTGRAVTPGTGDEGASSIMMRVAKEVVSLLSKFYSDFLPPVRTMYILQVLCTFLIPIKLGRYISTDRNLTDHDLEKYATKTSQPASTRGNQP